MLRQTEDHSLEDGPQSIAQAIDLTHYRGKRRSRKRTDSPKELASTALLESPAKLAVKFYIKGKFSGNLIAQILAKANIERDKDFGTIDGAGRFSDFKLDENGQSAQLQCWELFPYGMDESNPQRAVIHQQGYSLMLKSLGFVEDSPEIHSGLRPLEVSDPIDGLSETERNRLDALILVSLNERQFQLSQWERDYFFDSMGRLSRLFGS